MSHQLDKIFNADSVAIIGASEVPGKSAERRCRSLINTGYQGKIYFINPKRDQIFGRKAYPNILDIDGTVDLVMIVIPPQLIPAAIADSAKMGAKGAIVITSGFGEAIGEFKEQGKKIEQEILAEADKAGVAVSAQIAMVYSAPRKT